MNDLSIAVITAPRPVPTFDRSIRELRFGGFDQPIHVFAEPGSSIGVEDHLRITRNPETLGLWKNWRQAASTLLQDTDSKWLLICEDDIELAKGAATALRQAINLLPAEDWGYASLYTPKRNIAGLGGSKGWQETRLGAASWGALAYCFTRESLKLALHSKSVVLHASSEETDRIVSEAMLNLGRKTYTHIPSLCAHTGGGNSSVGHFSSRDMDAVGFDKSFDPQQAPRKPVANRENAVSHETPVDSNENQEAVRVGWILPNLAMGGVSRGIRTLIEHCDPALVRHAGVALASLESICERTLEKLGAACPILTPDPLARGWAISHVSSFRRAVEELISRSDVLELWGISRPEWIAQLQEVDWQGKPVVLRSRGSCDWTRRMLAGLLPFATHFSAVSEAAVQAFPAKLRSRVRILPNGVDMERCSPRASLEESRQRFGIDKEVKIIGYHGRADRAKRPESAAIAAAFLGKNYRSAYFGAGWTHPAAMKWVRDHDSAAFCHESVDHVGDVLGLFDAAILHSQSEGMSQSLLEYWMAGVPVVGTEVGAVRELERRHGPLLVKIDQNAPPETLAERVRFAMSELNAETVKNAQNTARTYFTATKMAHHFSRFMQSIARRRPAKLRVGLISHGLWLGGAEVWLASMVRHLQSDRVEVAGVAVTSDTGVDDGLARSIVENAPLYGPKRNGSPLHGRRYETGRFTGVCTTGRAAVDQVAERSDVLVTWGLPGVLDFISPHHKIPVVLCSQTSFQEPNPSPIPEEIHLAAASKEALKFFEGRDTDLRPKRVIYNGVSRERLAPRRGRAAQRNDWRVSDSETVVGFLGRQSREKGYLVLAQAMPRLPQNFRAVYYGQYQEQSGTFCPELLQFAERHCPGRIQFFLPREELGDVWAGLDVLVSSSQREAFGLVIAEAWLSGVPVVTTPTGIAHECGSLYGPLAIEIPFDPTPEETAEAIQRAAGPEGQALAKKAKQIAEREFTIEVMANRWREFLIEIADGRRTVRHE